MPLAVKLYQNFVFACCTLRFAMSTEKHTLDGPTTRHKHIDIKPRPCRAFVRNDDALVVACNYPPCRPTDGGRGAFT